MASTTSVISLFVLLLATYCYSVPVGHGYDISTPQNELSTGKIMTEHQSMSMITPMEQTTVHSMMHHRRKAGDQESQEATTVYPKRGLVEDSFTTSTAESTSEMMPKRANDDDDKSDELTTERQFSKDTKYQTRGLVEDLFTASTAESTSEIMPKRATDDDDKSDELTTERQFSKDTKYQTRGLVEDLYTTLAAESTSEMMPKRATDDDDKSDELTTERQFSKDAGYPKRGVVDDVLFATTEFAATSERPHHVRAFEHDSFTTMESSTQFNDRVPRGEEEKNEGIFTGKETSTIDSTSSVDSFGKSTGLLRHIETEEKPITSTSQTEQRVVKTETIIPGKITETRIYSGVPSRTVVFDELMTTESSRLSQGETMLHNADIKSNH